MARRFWTQLRRLCTETFSTPARARKSGKHGFPRVRPVVEGLETRVLPATYVVTTDADSGSGSLREAVNQANNGGAPPAQPDYITFAPGMAGKTVQLRSNDSGGTVGALLVIRSNIVITGLTGDFGVGITRANATPNRLFEVTSTGDLTLEYLTLTNGDAKGGDAYGENGEYLSFGQVSSRAGGGGAGLGGAIFNAGTVRINSSTFAANIARGGRGGQAKTGGGSGGGMSGNGLDGEGGGPNGGQGFWISSIDGDRQRNGNPGGFGGGGAGGLASEIGQKPGEGYIAGSGGNGGFGGGGGGGADGAGLAGVHSGGAGGGHGGFGGGGGGGGGNSGLLYDAGGGGRGGFGGGNGIEGDDDDAGAGGGGAGMGGAIFNYGGTVNIVNSTFYGNEAHGGVSPGGNDGSGMGGAIFNLSGNLFSLNNTFVFNVAESGRSLFVLGDGEFFAGRGTAGIYNTIVTSSEAGSTDLETNARNGGTLQVSGSNNLVGHASAAITTPDLEDQYLQPNLGSWGGPTPTQAISQFSAAYNRGDSNRALTLSNDQRGGSYGRIELGNPDIGAFEFQDAPPRFTSSAGQLTVSEHESVEFRARATDPESDPIEYSLRNAPAGASINSTSGVFQWALSESQGGQTFTFQVRATDTTSGKFAELTYQFVVTEVNAAPVFTSRPEGILSVYTAPVSIQLTASDSDLPVQTLIWSLVNAPAGASISSTGQFTWTPMTSQVGTWSFGVCVSDGVVSITTPLDLQVKAFARPRLDPIPDFTIGEVTSVMLPVSARVVDDLPHTISYSISEDPTGRAYFEVPTRIFHWAPQEADGPGSFSFTIRATVNETGLYSEERFTVTVNEVNRLPFVSGVPTSATIDEHTAYSFTVTALDFDAPVQTLTYSLVNGPAGATIGSDGTFRWTPTELQGAGTYSFVVRVSDGFDQVDSPITITVREVNNPPTLDPIATRTISESDFLSFNLQGHVTDDLPHTLNYSITADPTRRAIISTGNVFIWFPLESDGSQSFTFTVRATVNQTGLYAEQTFTVTIDETNQQPIVSGIPLSATIDELSAYSFAAFSYDMDVPAQTLTYSLVNGPAGATIGANGNFRWTPTEKQGPATYSFIVRVSDGLDQVDTPVTLTVREVYSPPTLAPIAAQTINERSTLFVLVDAQVADNLPHTIRYLVSVNPTGGASVGADGVFSWKPGELDGPGSHTFTVRATVNETGLYAEQTFTVTVSEVNEIPSVSGVPGVDTIDELVPYSFTAVASDADVPVQTLTYGLLFAPIGATIAANGRFSWTPTETQGQGIYSFFVSVNDGANEVYIPITLVVREVNVRPTLVLAGANSIVEGATYTLSLQPTDPDGVSITAWSINWGDGSVQTVTGSPDTVTHVYTNGPATRIISATATDDLGTWSSENTIAVTVARARPVVTFTGPTVGQRNRELSFSALFSQATRDGLQYSLSWGDGSSIGYTTGTNPGMWNGTHVYTALGTKTITFSVRDDRGGVTTVVQQITIRAAELQPDPSDTTKMALLVQGDTGVDKVVLGKSGSLVGVTMNGIDQGTYAVTSRVIVYGGAGNDSLQAPVNFDVPVYFDGGAGNDTLTGGAAADILIGGAGDDLIQGNGGRDLVIGGAGADRLLGGADEDLLLGGWTTYDADLIALTLVLQEWRRTDINVNLRRDHLRFGAVTALNDTVRLLTDEANATVFDDKAQDQLTGGTDTLDWLFLNSDGDGGILDRAVDATTLDCLEDLDWRP